MKTTVKISSNKQILGGEWCIDGTRIPVEYLLNMGDKKFVKEYPQLKNKFQ